MSVEIQIRLLLAVREVYLLWPGGTLKKAQVTEFRFLTFILLDSFIYHDIT